MRQDGLDPFSALRLHRGDLVALIGGGGKTTLMFAICAAAHERGLTAVATTTTRLHWIDDEEHNRHWVVASEFQDPISAVLQLLRSKGHAVLVRDRGEIRTKLLGYSPEELSKLRGLCPADLWAVEADGSRGRPLKAPIAHEPIIPNGATVVILVVGMDVVGSRLSERNVHRYERVAELLGTEPGVCIGADDVARVVNHRAGYLARIPAGARRVLYLSKIGKKDHREAAMAVSAMVDRTSWPEVYMGEVLDGEPRVEPLERQGKASEPFPFF
ncbi:MAG: putative selenium-dependent hydroxylase accessory protein YqeC [Planctomycetes bacterium]|nr:putative selenium-dependent hydroxylase accessory protein YqeC [Planctomycetota bacterium]